MTAHRPVGTSDREIVITRTYDASPERVFDAFTDSAALARWWGPDGFTTTTYEMNVRPGGVWRFVMHGPDGTDFTNLIEYVEVVRPVRLVYHHSDDGPDPEIVFESTVTLEPQGQGTALTLRMVFPSREERDRVVRDVGAIEGGNQTLGRLAAYLAERAG